MSDVISILIEMGFSKTRAEQAVATTRTDDVQVAMDWILSNEDDPVIEPVAETSDSNILEPPEKDTTTDDKVTADETDASSTSQQVAKSIRCDDCLKLFASQTDVEVHASKTGHENFSESSEEKKPLTEEEKKEQLARIEAKLKQRRLEREAKEKEILEAKKRHEELETKKLLELRRKEKEETRLAKERVKAQIEQDKIARRLKFGGAPPIEKVDSTPDTTVVTQKLSQPQNYSEVKLQIRLTNGSTLVHTFGAKEPLAAVRLYVQINRTDDAGPFTLMTPFPRHVFGPEDFDKPLDLLGLAPTAVLIVSKA
ncbi:ubx domain-containing protein 1 [Holotrichia oblita]|uniref:Ubx domain-containing protein 1 n=1 Tax=Holotrichia oblita TaxID=644536 RepID=A0ACB9T193_HOLOL|nr:ubx domain-containing protein 1 [Holotrichia oblita]